jgi:hypothetical protein
MALINVIIRVDQWERYKKGEEAIAYSLSTNPSGKMTITVAERELLSIKEKFQSHTQYLEYLIKKEI